MIRGGVRVEIRGGTAHPSTASEGGSPAAIGDVAITRRVSVDIDTAKPVLNTRSEERRNVEGAGREAGYDGMEITL